MKMKATVIAIIAASLLAACTTAPKKDLALEQVRAHGRCPSAILEQWTPPESTPEKILSFSVDPATGYQPFHGRRIAFMLGLEGGQVKQCVKLMGTLYKLFVDKDMEMLEINPLIVTDKGDLKCLDAKMGFDGNAVYRLW